MYYYILKDFGDGIGNRYLTMINGRPTWVTNPPASYLLDQAQSLSEEHGGSVVEVAA